MPFLSFISSFFSRQAVISRKKYINQRLLMAYQVCGSSLFLSYYIRYSKFIKEIFQELQNHLA